MQFGITEKPTTDCVYRYKITRASSLPLQGISANIRINLMSPECHWPTFLPLIVWVDLHSDFRGGLRKTHLICKWSAYRPFKSSKVVDFVTNRKGICDFLLVSNFGPQSRPQRARGPRPGARWESLPFLPLLIPFSPHLLLPYLFSPARGSGSAKLPPAGPGSAKRFVVHFDLGALLVIAIYTEFFCEKKLAVNRSVDAIKKVG